MGQLGDVSLKIGRKTLFLSLKVGEVVSKGDFLSLKVGEVVSKGDFLANLGVLSKHYCYFFRFYTFISLYRFQTSIEIRLTKGPYLSFQLIGGQRGSEHFFPSSFFLT